MRIGLQRILFIYPDPPGFSGQREASDQILRVLGDDSSLKLLPIRLPGYPRTEGGLRSKLHFWCRTVWEVIRLLAYAVSTRLDGVYVSLCQTRLPLIRELTLIRAVRACQFRTSRLPVVISLHGSVFMTWKGDEQVARLFRAAIDQATRVTVLGPNQERRLSSRFGADGRAAIVPNTCEVHPFSVNETERKHSRANDTGEHHVLHLSTLMEPKGYIQLVESLNLLRNPVELTICGRLAQTQYDKRFARLAEARRWLDARAEAANFRWIEGAYGDDKSRLFAQATIFVFPSIYAVEAQPLVLLEAMASGCAIITTSVGEIPFMLGEGALFIPDVEASTIAQALDHLIEDPAHRLELAMCGRRRFLEHFTLEDYRSNWQSIFASI